MCLRGISCTCAGACGWMSSNATMRSLSKTILAGSSRAAIRQNRQSRFITPSLECRRVYSPVSHLEMPERLLLGPGPSNVTEEVRAALARPLVGHLDPAFLALLDEVQRQLLALFRAPDGSLALPISGTGSAGMEACLVNLLEPGDGLLVAVNGVFGERMAAIGERCGARVLRVEAEMGEIVPPERLIAEIEAAAPTSSRSSTPRRPPESRSPSEVAPRRARPARWSCSTASRRSREWTCAWTSGRSTPPTRRHRSVSPVRLASRPLAIGPRAIARLSADDGRCRAGISICP